MDLSSLTREAKKLREEYSEANRKNGYGPWGVAEFAQGLVGDVGDLMKLIMAKGNFRSAQDANLDARIAHELGDCLWSLLILADDLGVDIEKAFSATMVEVRAAIRAEWQTTDHNRTKQEPADQGFSSR